MNKLSIARYLGIGEDGVDQFALKFLEAAIEAGVNPARERVVPERGFTAWDNFISAYSATGFCNKDRIEQATEASDLARTLNGFGPIDRSVPQYAEKQKAEPTKKVSSAKKTKKAQA